MTPLELVLLPITVSAIALVTIRLTLWIDDNLPDTTWQKKRKNRGFSDHKKIFK